MPEPGIARERLRYYLNFGEDGPWTWWWHLTKHGCLFGCKWSEPEEEETDYGSAGSYGTGWYYSDCLRGCGSVKGPFRDA